MKKITAALLLIMGATTLNIQAQTNKDYSSDVESIDAIITALYASISGEKGEQRDWDRFHNLFIDDARLISTGKNREGKIVYRSMSTTDYVPWVDKAFYEKGFFEYELHKEVHQFGHIAQVFSTYASKRSKHDAEPFSRGINSIQLMHDGSRWWVVTIYWASESADNPIPAKYMSDN